MKKFRIYYNRRGDLPWSIDEGSIETEQQFASLRLDGVDFTTFTDFTETDRENKPVAWLEGYAVMETEKMADGRFKAVFRIEPGIIE